MKLTMCVFLRIILEALPHRQSMELSGVLVLYVKLYLKELNRTVMTPWLLTVFYFLLVDSVLRNEPKRYGCRRGLRPSLT